MKHQAELKKQVCSWNQLEDRSKNYLLEAEFSLEQLKNGGRKDFWISALSYCKSLENEIREKLFKEFTIYTRKKYSDFSKVFEEDFKKYDDTEIYPNKKIAKKMKRARKKAEEFVKKIAQCKKDESPKIELGLMAEVLSFIYETEKFLVFNECKLFIEKQFKTGFPFWRELPKIGEIAIYRNDSAHPNGEILLDKAEKCREEILREIDKFLRSVK